MSNIFLVFRHNINFVSFISYVLVDFLDFLGFFFFSFDFIFCSHHLIWSSDLRIIFVLSIFLLISSPYWLTKSMLADALDDFLELELLFKKDSCLVSLVDSPRADCCSLSRLEDLDAALSLLREVDSPLLVEGEGSRSPAGELSWSSSSSWCIQLPSGRVSIISNRNSPRWELDAPWNSHLGEFRSYLLHHAWCDVVKLCSVTVRFCSASSLGTHCWPVGRH